MPHTNKRNILFITTDEQHRETISALGASTHTTPNMDLLLEKGSCYRNAYTVSPVCLPARCSWMTGLYPHNSGSISNIYGASLSLQLPNLFTLLRSAGYTTSLHGKCHFIPVPYPATRPDETLEYEHMIEYYKILGMDQLDLQDDKNNSLWYYDDYSKELERKNLLTAYRDEAHMNKANQGVFPFPHAANLHPDAWVAQRTIERIGKCSIDPQFVWCSFSGPHYPVDTPQEFIEQVDMSKDTGRIYSADEWKDASRYHCRGYYGPGTTEGSGHAPGGAQKNYDDAYWTRWRRSYFGNVVLIDHWIGQIMAAAYQAWGDDFTVIFTADHGEMMGNHSLWGKNGSLFEDVVRIPMAVYSPGQAPRQVDETVSSLEVFPTILALAGIAVPPHCDGRPLEEMCRKGGRDYVIAECENRVTIVCNSYKLDWNFMESTKTLHKEFYDLTIDPHEFTNRYNDPAYQQQIQALEAILEEKEQKEKLLSTVFYQKGRKPYWFNDGQGAGLHNNWFPIEGR